MDYIKTLLGQSSTWQGIAFFVGFGVVYTVSAAVYHLDQTASMTAGVAAGSSLSATIKIILKDQLK